VLASSSPPLPPVGTRLETPRLALRAARPSDVTEIRALLRRNGEHLRPWTPAPAPGEDPTSLTALSRTVLRHRGEWKRGEAFVFFVAKRERGEPLIGRVALFGVMRGVFQNAYLGYWIDKEHQGKGMTTEAVAAAVDFAMREAALHRVQAAVMPINAPSLRVLAKLGFRREGHAERYLCIAGKWEDHEIFATTNEEWARRG
jgi:ribosomal-protein-alanine N-acetyltransferase